MAAPALAYTRAPIEQPEGVLDGRWLALARWRCNACWGTGHVIGERSTRICACVCRQVCRLCLRFYHRIESDQFPLEDWAYRFEGRVHRVIGCRQREYRADLWLTARRILDDREWDIFRLHHLGGYGYRACCRRLGMDRGAFWHAVYFIEFKLGRELIMLRPYSLIPWEYFA